MKSGLRVAGWVGAAGVTAALIAVLAFGLVRPATSTVAAAGVIGKPAPELSVRTPTGEVVDLAALHGRPVVLNFFASWCAPCQAEAPVLSAGARAHPAVAFLGAAIEDDAAAAAAFVTRNDVPYPAGEIVAGSYLRYGVTGPPETFFIDSDGHVAAHVVGPLTADALEARLEALR